MRKKGIALIVTFIVIFSIHTSVFADNEFNFSDMKNHWSVEYVEELYNKGIITGYPDETFKPNNNVSRAEAIKMLTVATGEDVGSNKDGYWADNYIRQAISIGYVLEGEFDDYNKPMSRLELAKIIVRAMDEEYAPNMNEYSKQITDYDTINDKDKEYVLKAYVKGVITGYTDGTFRADSNITRAEASTMLVRLLEPDKRIVPELEKENKKDEIEDDFIEPELSVYFYKSIDAYDYFAIMIDNPEDYNEDPEVWIYDFLSFMKNIKYTFTVECISHPEINYQDMYSAITGKLLNANVNMIERYKNKGIQADGAIYRLYDFRDWRPTGSKEQFSPKEGEAMKYKVTVSNGEETREYFIELNFKYKEFRY